MAEHLKAELVTKALEMALWNRRPSPGLVHHSDHGLQGEFNQLLQHVSEVMTADRRVLLQGSSKQAFF